MQIIRRRGPRPLPDIQEPKVETRERDSRFSYFSTEVNTGQTIIVPGPCEIFVKGVRHNVVSLAFKIKRGLLIEKINAQRQDSED